jgi:hypothetical protein
MDGPIRQTGSNAVQRPRRTRALLFEDARTAMVNGFFNSSFNWEKFADEHGQYFLIAPPMAVAWIGNLLKRSELRRWHGFR